MWFIGRVGEARVADLGLRALVVVCGPLAGEWGGGGRGGGKMGGCGAGFARVVSVYVSARVVPCRPGGLEEKLLAF